MNGYVVTLLCLLLVPCAHAGLALFGQGLGRSRSATHTMLATLCAAAVAALAFALLGARWMGKADGLSHTFFLASRPWSWLGSGQVSPLIVAFGMFATSLAAIVPVNTGGDRWRLFPLCLSTAVFTAAVLPLYLHAVWGGGWLASVFGARDLGGAGAIHVAGGLAALSTALLAGPRPGKYTSGQAAAIPGHNIVLVLFGCLLSLVGYQALTMACGALVYHASLEQLAGIPANAFLAASAGLVAAVVHTRYRFGKIDASLAANGWMCGLVAQSAASFAEPPAAAALTGLIAGALTPWVVEWLETKLLIDDPVGALATYLGGGFCGLLLAAIFMHDGRIFSDRLLSALVMCACLLGMVFPLLHAVNWVLDRLTPFRTDADGETHGMDIRELGSASYPEFVIHAQDLFPR